MANPLPQSEWKSGAIDFDRMPMTAASLSRLVHVGGDVPIRTKIRSGIFPSFKVGKFSLVQDYGYVINVWRVRDAVETYHVIGGVQIEVDKTEGYISAYQRVLDGILANDEQSQQALKILDHIITNSLLNGD